MIGLSISAIQQAPARTQLVIPSLNDRYKLDGVSFAILAQYMANIINAEYGYSFELILKPELFGTSFYWYIARYFWLLQLEFDPEMLI